MHHRSRPHRLLLPVILLLLALPAAATPRIAIIIDDLGNQRAAADRVLALPGPVACAVLPHTPLAGYIGRRAPAAGKEVMLHLPLQPIGEALPAGLGGIDLDNTRRQLATILAADLASVPNVSGVNTHMGSLLTRHPGHMQWLMAELKRHGGLFFVDSYTTPASVALQMAEEAGLPATRRHVFLDNDPAPQAIEQEFTRLTALARLNGRAVAIGHPYEATLAFLEWAVPRLDGMGIELVGVAALIAGGDAPPSPPREQPFADTRP